MGKSIETGCGNCNASKEDYDGKKCKTCKEWVCDDCFNVEPPQRGSCFNCFQMIRPSASKGGERRE